MKMFSTNLKKSLMKTNKLRLLPKDSQKLAQMNRKDSLKTTKLIFMKYPKDAMKTTHLIKIKCLQELIANRLHVARGTRDHYQNHHKL